jgi:hypothetical protein
MGVRDRDVRRGLRVLGTRGDQCRPGDHRRHRHRHGPPREFSQRSERQRHAPRGAARCPFQRDGIRRSPGTGRGEHRSIGVDGPVAGGPAESRAARRRRRGPGRQHGCSPPARNGVSQRRLGRSRPGRRGRGCRRAESGRGPAGERRRRVTSSGRGLRSTRSTTPGR